MATKYKTYIQKMYQEHKDLFDDFDAIHAQYALDQETNQQNFNDLGRPIQVILQEYENRLCRQSEKGQYGVFSDKLAEKYWEEVKKRYPYIEFIGVEVTETNAPVEDPFSIKRIRLS